MSAKLATNKRLLTQSCNRLGDVLKRLKGEKLEFDDAFGEASTPGRERDARQRLQEAVGAIEAGTARIKEELKAYAVAVDETEELSEKEEKDFEQYATKAETLLDEAYDYSIKLESRLRSFTYNTARNQVISNGEDRKGTEMSREQSRVELPTVPIPTFNGNIWEWDNFWALFEANVHSQPLPELFKFNYLLKALKGDAYNAVKQFQITGSNYATALEYLRTKYGDTEELVNSLIDKLDSISARSNSLKDQRTLLETIQAIVVQLQNKGQHVDNQWVTKQILSKFPEKLQRRVLEKRQTTGTSEQAKVMDLLKSLEEFITREEKITSYLKRTTTSTSEATNPGNSSGVRVKQSGFSCMYCGDDHKAMRCSKYKTPQERARYLREHKLCFICASPRHPTSECKRRVCFICQGPHHSSSRFSEKSTRGEQNMDKVSATSPSTKESTTRYSPKSKQYEKERQRIKQVSTSTVQQQIDEDEEANAVELHSAIDDKRKAETYLPTGEITIIDPRTQNLRRIPVLLDTGAQLSFIDSALAEELQLPILETKPVNLLTFGSEQAKESLSREVVLEMWDKEGCNHTLHLLTHDVLIKPLKTPPLLEEDIEYIRLHDPTSQVSTQSSLSKPLILLGCDQVWTFIKEGCPPIRLPSGLFMLPTRLGYLLTGQLLSIPNLKGESTEAKEKHVGDTDNLSLESQINTFLENAPPDNAEERTLWEKYWILEKEGTEEFTSAEKDIQSRTDQEVMENFMKPCKNGKTVTTSGCHGEMHP